MDSAQLLNRLPIQNLTYIDFFFTCIFEGHVLEKKSEVAIRQIMSIHNAQIIHVRSHVILIFDKQIN